MKKNKKIYQAPVSRVITMDTSQNMLVISGGTPKDALKPNDWTPETDDGVITEQ
jgi:hypothetical protein